MIRSFKHKGLKKFFETGDVSGIKPSHKKRLQLTLTVLNVARTIADIDKPSLRLHALKGQRQKEWAVSISGSWRLTFRFQDGDVFLLNHEDYH